MDFVRTLTKCSREEAVSTRTGRIPCVFESTRCLGRETASVFHGLFHALCLSLRPRGCRTTTRTQSPSSLEAILPRGPAGGGAMQHRRKLTAPQQPVSPCGRRDGSATRLARSRPRLTATRAPACGARPWRLRGGPRRRGRRSRSRPAGGGALPRTSRWRGTPRRAASPPSARG